MLEFSTKGRSRLDKKSTMAAARCRLSQAPDPLSCSAHDHASCRSSSARGGGACERDRRPCGRASRVPNALSALKTENQGVADPESRAAAERVLEELGLAIVDAPSLRPVSGHRAPGR